MRTKRRSKKFTYGGRRIERPDVIGPWAQACEVLVLIGVLGLYAIGYCIVVLCGVSLFCFGGWYVCSRFGWL